MPQTKLDPIRPKIQHFLRQDGIGDPLKRLQDLLPAECDLFILGGALRNIIAEHFHGRAPRTQDVDIFVGNLETDFDLQGCFKEKNCTVTELGGVRWQPNHSTFSFDLCPLDRFFNIEKHQLAPTLENLLAGTDFSVNAVVWNIKSESLTERQAVDAIQRKTIDFNTDRFLTRNLLLYRVLVMRHKLDFILSRQVYNFVKQQTDSDALYTLKNSLHSKLGKTTAQTILKDYDRINGYEDYPEYVTSEWKRIHGAGS